jgi:putative transposase
MQLTPTSTYGSLVPHAEYIRSLVRRGTISKQAFLRLNWMDHYRRSGNARLTCRYFGISAQTFYRWKRRYDPYDLKTLEAESRRPHRVRRPETSAAVIEAIQALREQYPRWGRDKLAVLLKRRGIRVSGSTVGRVMARLRARGLLVEPENVRLAKLARKRRRKPRYATRFPRGYEIDAPGALVQIDTLQVTLIPDEIRYHFGARDRFSKYDAYKAYRRQTSSAAADFLHHLRMKFPFRIRAIQIDGGSEFMDQFEIACREQHILLFVNLPNCPRMNGGVERSHQTQRREFYEVQTVSLRIDEHNQQLDQWADVYNFIRPHRALDMSTPHEYYLAWRKAQRKVSRMS